MRLSDLDEVKRLNERRDYAIRMRTAAMEGSITCTIMLSGTKYSPIDMIGKPPVVRAIAEMEREMAEAAEAMEFERAALLRDQIYELKQAENPFKGTAQVKKRKPIAYHPGKSRLFGGGRKRK